MRNLIASEIHLRDLTNKREVGHDSCIRKHLLFIENELGEAQSHATVIKPELVKIFKKLEQKVINLRKGLSQRDVIKSINEVRIIRKKVEELNPEYDTSNCISCQQVEKEVEKAMNNSRNLKSKVYKVEKPINNNIERPLKRGEKSMEKKDVGVILGGQFVGKGVDFLSDYVDTSMEATARPVLERPSTWINVGGGLGLVGLALFGQKYLKSPALQLGATVLGTYMLAKVVDYAQEYTTITPTPPTPPGGAIRVMTTPNSYLAGRAIAGI